MKFPCAAAIALLMTCQTSQKPVATRHHAATRHSNKKPVTVLVDSQWMAQYKQLESKFDYHIPADSEIKEEGSKFRVPQAVIDHHADMIKAQ